MGISYNRNASLVVDADLTLFVVDADVYTELLRSAFEVERRVAQTRIRRRVTQTRVENGIRSCSNSRETRNYLDPRLKFLFFFGRKVCVLIETRPSC